LDAFAEALQNELGYLVNVAVQAGGSAAQDIQSALYVLREPKVAEALASLRRARQAVRQLNNSRGAFLDAYGSIEDLDARVLEGTATPEAINALREWQRVEQLLAVLSGYTPAAGGSLDNAVNLLFDKLDALIIQGDRLDSSVDFNARMNLYFDYYAEQGTNNNQDLFEHLSLSDIRAVIQEAKLWPEIILMQTVFEETTKDRLLALVKSAVEQWPNIKVVPVFDDKTAAGRHTLSLPRQDRDERPRLPRLQPGRQPNASTPEAGPERRGRFPRDPALPQIPLASARAADAGRYGGHPRRRRGGR
jgi:hypothetical protein